MILRRFIYAENSIKETMESSLVINTITVELTPDCTIIKDDWNTRGKVVFIEPEAKTCFKWFRGAFLSLHEEKDTFINRYKYFRSQGFHVV